jgi:hypothetical protein
MCSRTAVNTRALSVVSPILSGVQVSAEAVAKVPVENLRVSRADFGALWALAQRLGARPGPDDPFLIGVLRSCQWLAGQPVWVSFLKRWEMPVAPLTRRRHAAMPETIEAEYLAAATAAAFERERARGVMATLEWTWYGSGRPPMDLSSAAAG